jgi:hypothetical protein
MTPLQTLDHKWIRRTDRRPCTSHQYASVLDDTLSYYLKDLIYEAKSPKGHENDVKWAWKGCGISFRAAAAEARVWSQTALCRTFGEEGCTAIRSSSATSVWLLQLSVSVLRSFPVSVIPPVLNVYSLFILFWCYNRFLSEIDRIVKSTIWISTGIHRFRCLQTVNSNTTAMRMC